MAFKFVPYFMRRFYTASSPRTVNWESLKTKKNSIAQFGLGTMVGGLIVASFFSTVSLDDHPSGNEFLKEEVVTTTVSAEVTEVKKSEISTRPRLLSAEINEITMNDVKELVMNASKVSYSVPAAETGAKRWMDYRHITAKSSMQYKLQQDAWTDEYGFRRYGEYYMIAMGTYYADQCGKLFEITLENGFTFWGLISDIKQDQHTDSLHQHRYGNVVEFIIDKDKIPHLAKVMGDMSYAFDEMNAKIASIREIKT